MSAETGPQAHDLGATAGHGGGGLRVPVLNRYRVECKSCREPLTERIVGRKGCSCGGWWFDKGNRRHSRARAIMTHAGADVLTIPVYRVPSGSSPA